MARMLLLTLGGLLAACGMALSQAPDAASDAAATAPAAPAQAGEGAATAGGNAGGGTAAISGNPAAVNIVTGNGKLGEWLGFSKESGIRLGGLWLGDYNWLAAGGLDPGQWGGNSLTIVDLNVDAEKRYGWKGGMFGVQFLNLSGAPVNADAGVVQGYNSIDARPPFTRSELYQLWWRQSFFDDKLIVRIGKTVPTYDFNNVARPVPTGDPAADIPAVSGLIFTPIFVNPTLVGKIPGYYNSATGVTTTVVPNKNVYLSYGFYDGNNAAGQQTGLRGPEFNGHYFHIWEVGRSWRIGAQQKPGMAAVGIWDQTGTLTAVNGARVRGAQGVYTFGSQRLWFRNPGLDNSGVSGYYQFGANNTNTSVARQYFGSGLTAFGLVPGRKYDSFGAGVAWAFLNTDPNAGAFFFPNAGFADTNLGSNELMMQGYYQMVVRDGIFFQPALSYIPNPGQRSDIHDALAVTVRLTMLF